MKFPPYQKHFKKLLLQSYFHSYYIQTKYDGKEEIINNIYCTNAEPLLNYINNPVLVKERKHDLDAASYEKK